MSDGSEWLNTVVSSTLIDITLRCIHYLPELPSWINSNCAPILASFSSLSFFPTTLFTYFFNFYFFIEVELIYNVSGV